MPVFMRRQGSPQPQSFEIRASPLIFIPSPHRLGIVTYASEFKDFCTREGVQQCALLGYPLLQRMFVPPSIFPTSRLSLKAAGHADETPSKAPDPYAVAF